MNEMEWSELKCMASRLGYKLVAAFNSTSFHKFSKRKQLKKFEWGLAEKEMQPII